MNIEKHNPMLTLVDRLRENIRVFETVALELSEKLSMTPAKSRGIDHKNGLAAVSSHIIKLKRQLSEVEQQ